MFFLLICMFTQQLFTEPQARGDLPAAGAQGGAALMPRKGGPALTSLLWTCAPGNPVLPSVCGGEGVTLGAGCSARRVHQTSQTPSWMVAGRDESARDGRTGKVGVFRFSWHISGGVS